MIPAIETGERPADFSDVRPLDGIRVVDFSTLLPGPLASLILSEAGADVVKIERSGVGDEMRTYEPRIGSESANFALLNRGKRSVALDLKEPDDLAAARSLVLEADVLIEQFRPGVMARLGLSYAELAEINPRLIYCSITGYGQTGPKAQVAAHDLNYLAETGFLSLAVDREGTPAMTASPLSDIGGGSYPAVINILLALAERQRTGRGRHLDVSMSDNVFPFLYWALGSGFAGKWPQPGRELVTGGSARYRLYRTKDDRFVAAAPIEDRFWKNFCQIVGVPESSDARTIEKKIAQETAAHWRDRFAGHDVCCSIVASVQEALLDPQVAARGIVARTVEAGGVEIPALPLPLVAPYRDPVAIRSSPELQRLPT